MTKIITRMRRWVKSYLLFNLFLKYLLENGISRDHIIDIANDNLRDSYVLYNHVRSKIIDNQPYAILLDEIQFVNCFVDVLNGFSL